MNGTEREARQKSAARDLLSIGAVFLRPDEPFTWASGIQSPIYCDNRLILTAPEIRARIEKNLADMIREDYPDVEILMGTATAGIAHAAIAGYLLNLPMGYVRTGGKDHGRRNQIEGALKPGQRAVVVEDLISTGGSCIAAAEALRRAGAEALGVAAIFSYNLQEGAERFRQAGLQYRALCDFDVLCETAVESGRIRPGDLTRLKRFRTNPRDESWMK